MIIFKIFEIQYMHYKIYISLKKNTGNAKEKSTMYSTVFLQDKTVQLNPGGDIVFLIAPKWGNIWQNYFLLVFMSLRHDSSNYISVLYSRLAGGSVRIKETIQGRL